MLSREDGPGASPAKTLWLLQILCLEIWNVEKSEGGRKKASLCPGGCKVLVAVPVSKPCARPVLWGPSGAEPPALTRKSAKLPSLSGPGGEDRASRQPRSPAQRARGRSPSPPCNVTGVARQRRTPRRRASVSGRLRGSGPAAAPAPRIPHFPARAGPQGRTSPGVGGGGGPGSGPVTRAPPNSSSPGAPRGVPSPRRGPAPVARPRPPPVLAPPPGPGRRGPPAAVPWPRSR
jgi:hypothetical protein